jgi:dienelactone hydrolase
MPSKLPIDSTAPSGTCFNPFIPWCTFIVGDYNTRKTGKESNMRIVCCALLITGICSNLMAAIKTKTIEYKHGDTVLEGFLAWDDSTTAKRPAVIVVHEWWGNNEYSHKRAEMLAQLGYVGFAIDMFGKGKITNDPKVAGEWAGAIKNDPKMAVERLRLGLDTLKAQPGVDAEKIAAIGYCFGGWSVLQMARNNLPIDGVVSFHGALAGGNPNATQPIKPKVLVCHGADDPFESPKEISDFADEMRNSKADWQFISYGGAVHSFTNPDVDKYKLQGAAYNKQADQRSWVAMKDFLHELFGA